MRIGNVVDDAGHRLLEEALDQVMAKLAKFLER
jgi:hypothetical protein